MLLADERAAVVECCRRMAADGLTVATSGNVSVRRDGLVAITASGVDYAGMTPADVCVVDLDGRPVEPGPVPSSELAMHTHVYRATDAGAVVHTHPTYATTLSVLVDELPAVHYLVAALGGPVRVAPYATYGSVELAEHSVRGLADRYGVILRHHGATTYGDTLDRAYTRSLHLEWCARLYYQARLLGEPAVLPDAEVARVAERLAGYGQPPPG